MKEELATLPAAEILETNEEKSITHAVFINDVRIIKLFSFKLHYYSIILNFS